MTETTGVTPTVLRFRSSAKTIRMNPRTNTPSFSSTPSTLRCQEFSGTINNFDNDFLLSYKHAVTDDDGTDSEGGNVGDEYKNEELPMSDQEGVDISKSRK